MKSLLSKLLVVLMVAALPMTVSAAESETPFQFSFFDVNAPAGDDVVGVHLSVIYGKTGNVTGWDWPLLAFSDMGSLTGFSGSPVGLASISRVRGNVKGVTLGLFSLQEGKSIGANFNGLANITNDSMADFAAFFNKSNKSNFQMSLVNVTEELDGVQIGLVNCAKNGFLPCFVLFNFGTTDK